MICLCLAKREICHQNVPLNDPKNDPKKRVGKILEFIKEDNSITIKELAKKGGYWEIIQKK